MRALRIAAEAIQLVLPEIGPPQSPDRWASLPPATQRQVLALLSGLIARGVLAEEPARRGRRPTMSEASNTLVPAKIAPVHLGRDAYV